MRKDANTWDIIYNSNKLPHKRKDSDHLVDINDMLYHTSEDAAAICHAILLLVDAINDKDFK